MSRILALFGLWAAAVLASLAIGSVDLGLGDVALILASQLPLISDWTPAPTEASRTILIDIRLPRVLMAGVVGAALALSGTALQGLFRNPMASPYVLGISAGAALGAVVALVQRIDFGLPVLSPLPLLAFLGALTSTLVVYFLARIRGRVPVATLLLSGVAMASFLSAVVSMILVFSESDAASVLFWLMGRLSSAQWSGLGLVMPYFLLGAAFLIYYSRDLNALLLGEEASHHLGIDVERVKRHLLFATSLLTAAAVSVTGIIGFVGLIVPHIVRLLAGPDHRSLIPMAGLAGAILLTAMDTLARSLLPSQEIPVGAISALLGGPFFLILLRRHRVALF